MANSLILTCSLCANFCPNRQVCKLNDEPCKVDTLAEPCKNDGKFIRYMYTIPNAYNFFSINEDIPPGWRPDLTRIPTDKKGLPLVVKTKRGLERAIPADPTVTLEVTPKIDGKVPLITTYQGQREIIYELGVKLASEEAAKAGVPLTVLPEEHNWEGISNIDLPCVTSRGNQLGKAWLTDTPVQWNY